MKFPHDEKALLYNELAKLSGSGFPLTEALDAIIDTHPPDATMQLMTAAKSSLANSSTIGEAFASTAEVPVTELEKSIIAASERGGVLEEGFEHLADYFKMRHRAAKAMRSKMLYPIVLLHVALLIPIAPLLITSSDPKSVLIISLGALVIIYILAFLGIQLGRQLARKAETEVDADRLLSRLPLVGAVRQNLALARFTSVFRMHLLAGERIDESLRSSAGAARSGRILDSIKRNAIPAVENGQPVGPALAGDPDTFTAAFGRSFITAENSGTLDKDLARWSERFQGEAKGSMDRLASRAPRIFYLFAVVIAIWQIYRLASNYFGMFDKILNNGF